MPSYYLNSLTVFTGEVEGSSSAQCVRKKTRRNGTSFCCLLFIKYFSAWSGLSGRPWNGMYGTSLVFLYHFYPFLYRDCQLHHHVGCRMVSFLSFFSHSFQIHWIGIFISMKHFCYGTVRMVSILKDQFESCQVKRRFHVGVMFSIPIGQAAWLRQNGSMPRSRPAHYGH